MTDISTKWKQLYTMKEQSAAQNIIFERTENIARNGENELK